MDNRELARAHLGELLDRILRFEMHLKAVENEFFRSNVRDRRGASAGDNPLFLKSFRACVDELLNVVRDLVVRARQDLNEDALQQLLFITRHGFICVTELHERGLVHLPRPSEPTELRRFLRTIAKHVLLEQGPALAVYVTEGTTETSFADDPLAVLRLGPIAGVRTLTADFLGSTIPGAESTIDKGIQVTIARIDSRNPLRWPTLMHEAAHKLLSKETIGETSLEAQLKEWLPEPVMDEIASLAINVRAWLTEVWCDLFAALVLGPAFFFAQFAAFVASPPVDSFLSREYPPHGFRLRLIRYSLLHRYPAVTRDAGIQREMTRCISVVETWDRYHRIDVATHHRLKVVFDSMLSFFREHFFGGSGDEVQNVQTKFAKMVRYVHELQVERLEEIRESFSDNLPAPSKPHGSGVRLAEEPTSIQEVILAAWLDRLRRLREESLSALEDYSAVIEGASIREALLPAVDRFDETVLRSLQIAEWLHVLVPTEPKSTFDEVADQAPQGTDGLAGHVPSSSALLLNDREILALLDSGELRVAPLVDLEQQLGSTSLDLRLGTSFEVYLPAYRRGTEAAENSDSYDSRSIDLDYLEHIVLLPGQIVLGHTFEYLRLPPTVAGELDGRSSYARLGLQVHLTAGMIDPGFEGVITFELVNSGSNPIELHPGVRIAQLRLIRIAEPARPYHKRRTAKYRGLLHHHTSLYKSDPDFARLAKAREDLHLPSRVPPPAAG